MNYKDGVFVLVTKIVNGQPINLAPSKEIMNAMAVADGVSRSVAGREMTVTSLLDGVHMKNSLHYSGNAFDMRVYIYTEEQIKLIVELLKSKLGKNYDVLFENNDHIHVEYQPR